MYLDICIQILKGTDGGEKNPIKQARLDYFITSDSFTDIVTSCKINPGYRSDHSILELNVKINTFQRGKGLWKFNCGLLKNENYIEMINKATTDTKLEYAVPIYTYEHLNADNDWDMQFTIDDNLLLEMLLLKIRGITTSYSSSLTKAEAIQEKKLLKDIDSIENSNLTYVLLDTLETKKEELLIYEKKD